MKTEPAKHSRLQMYVFYFVSLSLLLCVSAANFGVSEIYDYHRYPDDVLLVEVMRDMGLVNGAHYLFEQINGRYMSHFLSLAFARVLLNGPYSLMLFYSANLALFICSVCFFLKRFLAFRYSLKYSFVQLLPFAVIFYVLFYAFCIGKHYEFWYWYSAIIVYQFSLILLLFIAALLMNERGSFAQHAMLLSGCFAMGFFAETHAATLLLLLLIFALIKISKRTFTKELYAIITGGLLTIASLLINFFSQGNASKMHITNADIFSWPYVQKAIADVTSDLMFTWDATKFTILDGLEIWNVLFRLLAIGFMALSVHLFQQHFINNETVKPVRRNPYLLIALGLFIFFATQIMCAWLYAGTAINILDRSKFIGYIAVFIGLLDYFICMKYNKAINRSK